MKKRLLLLMFAFIALYSQAQNNANVIRFYFKDGTQADFKISKVEKINKVANIGLNIIFNDNTPNKSILLVGLDYFEPFYDETIINDNDDNINKNIDPRALGLEFPKLQTEGLNILSQPSTSNLGITYSIEWDCEKKAQRWTCFKMHNGLPDNNVGRNDSWKEDTNIPQQYRTSGADYSDGAFSRGHMCASSDRQTSVEQNKQTFLYSNMHPQYQKHNGVLWNQMEQKIQNTWDKSTFRDTLYVLKAGTIRDDQVLKKTTGGLLVPQYFYMAVLCVKDGKYKALAFWTVHENVSITKADLGKYAISIQELENRTGIDFFCNLKDDIEEQVESTLNLKDWGL